jgi:hypothetical protein
MDLDKEVRLVPTTSDKSLDGRTSLTLFDAVRKWTDDEGAGDYAIESEGKPLTAAQIEEVAHSQDYIDKLLAFEERR